MGDTNRLATERSPTAGLSRLVAGGWQIAGIGLVVAVVASWSTSPSSLTHDLSTPTRLAAAVLGLVAGGAFLWLSNKFDPVLYGRHTWLRLVVLATAAGMLFVIRPRLHWGDSAALVSALDGGVHRWNPRWLTSMVGLAYLFEPFRALIPGSLFLTLVYIGLGCLDLALFMATVAMVSDGRRVPGAALLLVLASPATLFLMSGYLEIYALPQFGIVTFLWAAAAFSVRRPSMSPQLFGLTCGLASMLYVGNLILLPLGAALAGRQILADRAVTKKVRALFGFVAGTAVGVYASIALVIGEALPSVPRLLAACASLLAEPVAVFRHEATGAAWYAPLAEALSANRAREFCETWSLYGFFGLFFLLALASLLAVDREFRQAMLVEGVRSGYLPMLAALVGFLLAVSYVKTRPLGWRDWDVLIYAAYPVNLLAACLLTRFEAGKSVSTLGRTFSVCATVWCAMVYVYLNPVRPEWGGPPARRRASALATYDLSLRFAPSDAEARGIRERHPFP